MQSVDGVGACLDQDLVTPLERWPAEVVGRELHELQVGARGTVEHEDAIFERVQIRIAARAEAREEWDASSHGHQGYRCHRIRRPAWSRRTGSLGLMRIYTRKGDDGTTGLLFGGRVRKDAGPIEINGAVDEAQAAIGVARAHGRGDAELAELCVALERDLYVLMAEVATLPENRSKLVAGVSLVTPEMVEGLEASIDRLTECFEMPTEFVLPGENLISASLDVARTTVRRAERLVVTSGSEGSLVGAYLNRLSDLLWTMARWQEGEQHPLAKEATAP